MEEDKMNGRRSERKGTEGICMFFCFFLFLVSNTEEGWKARRGLWLGDANLLIILFYSFTDIRIRAGCRHKMSCKGKGKRSGIRLANGSRIKMHVCQVFSLLSCLTCIRFRQVCYVVISVCTN